MVTLLYAALCTLLILVLAGRVMAARMKYRVGLGDGGNAELNRRVRAHANAVEYVPLALLLLGGMELNLLLSRVLHAWGLHVSAGTSPGRFAGTLLTLLLMIVMALFAIAGFIQQHL